ncbi:uncharacterized protein G2W53_014288 [Senna tora]|uniref:Uncharacterized protein n=1 Tax=Senna tora TaxID=362788 RepID=A0A834WT82_9FABA|nr:uncharacterized protein G2W53_014288 [Senna tora]
MTRQKTCCASESNTSVRVVFANRSGFDAPIGVVLAWEERGSCVNVFRTKNRGQTSEIFMNYEAKDMLRNESKTSVRVIFVNRSGFDTPIGVVLAWEERGSCVNIFRMTSRGWISKIFTNYEAKDLLRNELNTSVRVLFANRSGFDAPIGVVLAREECGSCLNIFWMTNCARISETFMNYKAKDLLRKKLHELRGKRLGAQSDLRNLHELRGKRLVAQVSQRRRFALYLRTGVDLMLQLESSSHGRSVDHVLTYSGREIAVGSQKPSRITRQKTCCASESKTSIRVVFANQSGFDAPIGVFLAWQERGPCLNIFRMENRGRISESFTNYEAKELLRK